MTPDRVSCPQCGSGGTVSVAMRRFGWRQGICTTCGHRWQYRPLPDPGALHYSGIEDDQ